MKGLILSGGKGTRTQIGIVVGDTRASGITHTVREFEHQAQYEQRST